MSGRADIKSFRTSMKVASLSPTSLPVATRRASASTASLDAVGSQITAA